MRHNLINSHCRKGTGFPFTLLFSQPQQSRLCPILLEAGGWHEERILTFPSYKLNFGRGLASGSLGPHPACACVMAPGKAVLSAPYFVKSSLEQLLAVLAGKCLQIALLLRLPPQAQGISTVAGLTTSEPWDGSHPKIPVRWSPALQ